MNRKRRTEILINGSEEISAAFMREIAGKYRVELIEEPNNGMVMVKMRETAKGCLFYLGEILVTECKVSINGYLGIGMVQGHKPETAYRLAVIDAAYNACLKETEELDKILQHEETKIHHDVSEAVHEILKTRVSFETMDQS